jgi:hypothetical protein
MTSSRCLSEKGQQLDVHGAHEMNFSKKYSYFFENELKFVYDSCHDKFTEKFTSGQ